MNAMTRKDKRAWTGLGLLLLTGMCPATPLVGQAPPAAIQFKPLLLTVDANEGIDVADVDQDGVPDIIAGRNWFPGPDYRPRPLRTIEDWNGYVESNGDFAYDVDQDGWVDVVAGSFLPTQVHWYRNPGAEGLKLGQLWKPSQLADTEISQNEASFLRDLDGDGTPEWITNSWNAKNPVTVWKFDRQEQTAESPAQHVLRKIVIGRAGHGHGMGFGDLNMDGREDILVAQGWYERPAEGAFAGEQLWTHHPDWSLSHVSCPMLIKDVDGDGRNDILWGHGHGYGLHWWRATGTNDEGQLTFDKQVIDERYSQAHVLHLADLDGDGQDELITGKRVRAHNGNDPGGKEIPCMYYYRWDAANQQFERFTIDEGHIGTGLQIRSADLDADGDVDLAVAGKDGTWVLLNQRLAPAAPGKQP